MCQGEHLKADSPDEPPVYCNCGWTHPASWRGWPTHKKIKLQNRSDAKVISASRTNTTLPWPKAFGSRTAPVHPCNRPPGRHSGRCPVGSKPSDSGYSGSPACRRQEEKDAGKKRHGYAKSHLGAYEAVSICPCSNGPQSV